MDSSLLINGRFLTQTLSGVQRFATEITEALLQKYPDRIVVLSPKGLDEKPFNHRVVGKFNGQLWEQLELPSAVKSGMLINLGNTAPLYVQRQLVVIHDAGVFATPEAYDWKFRAWYKFMQRRLLDRNICVSTVSEFSRSELVRFFGAKSEEISIISEGADHMAKIQADPQVLKKIPPGQFVVVVGNLAAHKNLHALSHLARHLTLRKINLVITGGLEASAFQKVTMNVLPQPACYIGRVSDRELKALYEAAACLVFPSRYEGFGLPAIEAMACCCPVIASRIPALRETCGEAAIYSDFASPSDITEKVLQLLDQPDLANALRTAGHERARAFTWTKAASQLVDAADHFKARQKQ